MSQELDSRLTQLTASHERQATVLGGMIEGVIAVDQRERVLSRERRGRAVVRLSAAASRRAAALGSGRDHALRGSRQPALATRQPQRLETTQEGGEKMSVAIQATPLPGDPCPGVVIVMHETTELRRLESLRRDFVANVSHELKTPLSSIKAYAETLRNGRTRRPRGQHRRLSSGSRSRRIGCTTYSRHAVAGADRVGQQMFEIVPVSVSGSGRRMLCEPTAGGGCQANRIVGRASRPDVCVRADKEGLREILDNLVDNAIKYTPRGPRRRFAGGRRRIRGWRRSRSRTRASGIAGGRVAAGVRAILPRRWQRSRELGGRDWDWQL